VLIQSDATLRSKRKLYNQWQYQINSNYGELLPQTALTRTQWLTYTYLPKDSNPKAKAFAQRLKQQADNIPLFLEVLRSYISTQGFNYTLSPGVYDGDHQIDDFLFDSKSGFCSYYAGSLAFLLRAINVPSRVVVGYMGGEDNEISQTMSIYQRDAHAWVEVFIEGQGWLRLDPTAWVSPERVESGLQQAIPNEFKGFNSNAQWLKDLRKQWQAFDYLWNEWMLSYKGGKQQALLQDLWGARDTNELIVLLLGVFICLGLGLFGFLWWDQRAQPLSNEQKIFHVLLTWLQGQASSKKVDLTENLTMGQVFEKLKAKYPNLCTSLTALNNDVNRQLYYSDAQGINKQDDKRLIKLIRILKKQTNKPPL
jgi:transglutaminase-like putative cysteine protease